MVNLLAYLDKPLNSAILATVKGTIIFIHTLIRTVLKSKHQLKLYSFGFEDTSQMFSLNTEAKHRLSNPMTLKHRSIIMSDVVYTQA